MATQPLTTITATFQLLGDKFEHAWYFNRFRCDKLGGSILVTAALFSAEGGVLAINGFVLSQADLKTNRERSLNYLSVLALEDDDDASGPHSISVPPARVYPVNHINLARMDDIGEIGLFRFSIHTLLTKQRGLKSAGKLQAKNDEGSAIPCYPVVMFRSDLAVQAALLRELYGV